MTLVYGVYYESTAAAERAEREEWEAEHALDEYFEHLATPIGPFGECSDYGAHSMPAISSEVFRPEAMVVQSVVTVAAPISGLDVDPAKSAAGGTPAIATSMFRRFPDPLGAVRFFVAPRERKILDIVREDLREDLRQIIDEGRGRWFALAVIWWRSLTEAAPFFWRGIKRLLPFKQLGVENPEARLRRRLRRPM